MAFGLDLDAIPSTIYVTT